MTALSDDALRAELAKLETEIAPVLAEMNEIKAKLAPYEGICDKLADTRKQLRALEEALLEFAAVSGETPEDQWWMGWQKPDPGGA